MYILILELSLELLFIVLSLLISNHAIYHETRYVPLFSIVEHGTAEKGRSLVRSLERRLSRTKG